MSAASPRNDFVAVIALLVVVIGMATGHAYLMLGLSTASLLFLGLFYRKQISSGVILFTVAVAFVAAFTGAFIAMR